VDAARIDVAFKAGTNNDKLSIKAEFALDQLSGLPSDTGFQIILVDADMNPVYLSTIPAASIDNKKGRRFRFRDKEHLVSEANGLDKAVIAFSTPRNLAKVKAKLKSKDLPAAEGQGALTVSLLFGPDDTGDCVTGLDLPCSVSSARISCKMP
jgi:hypothetical protein